MYHQIKICLSSALSILWHSPTSITTKYSDTFVNPLGTKDLVMKLVGLTL